MEESLQGIGGWEIKKTRVVAHHEVQPLLKDLRAVCQRDEKEWALRSKLSRELVDFERLGSLLG